jgi:hypothetical protein
MGPVPLGAKCSQAPAARQALQATQGLGGCSWSAV